MFVIKYKYDGETYLTECEDDEKEHVLEGMHTSAVYGRHHIKPARVISIEHYDGTVEDNQYWR